jgi:hypothetical protein
VLPPCPAPIRARPAGRQLNELGGEASQDVGVLDGLAEHDREFLDARGLVAGDALADRVNRAEQDVVGELAGACPEAITPAVWPTISTSRSSGYHGECAGRHTPTAGTVKLPDQHAATTLRAEDGRLMVAQRAACDAPAAAAD